MPRDELRQPLKKRSLGERLWARRPSGFMVAAASLAALFVGGSAWLMRLDHPFAGEPVVTAAIPPVEELHTAAVNPPDPSPKDQQDSAQAPEDVIDENAAVADANAAPQEDLPTSAPPAYQNEAQIIVARTRPLKKAPVDAVTETTPDGPLPRVSDRGKKPFDIYSQVTPMQVSASGRPKITILLGGMGLNARLTEMAIKELPGDVSLGFAPYGDNLQEQVNRARANGHEVMLQLPMEPVGYPGTNPGPKTLLADATEQANIDSLHWLMSRFAGYSGITNYMGARLLVSEPALTPIMKEIRQRGLVYLEDATVNLTLSPKIVQQVRLPMQRANMVIDGEPTAPAISDMLQKLENEAIANGSAIGTGSGLEVTIDTVAEWAKSLDGKGILLVPVSAAYKGRST